MLGPASQRLLSVASDALSSHVDVDLPESPLFRELAELLSQRNGFYAFESALHVLGVGENVLGRSLDVWNSGTSWRADYGGLARGFTFFAEDIFGAQFA